ncbi:MAG: Asp-tRNA(Asn)/Glu-tRNA(Gln) amidotransferase subunit GatC [bacterium]|nr:Asp-tRNA(Asn)/Glu-tRNA(Gln) amidotransferase subunit GatC [bacterium]
MQNSGKRGIFTKMVTREEIQKLAELSRIEVGEDEVEKLRKDIGGILEYVAQIKSVSPQTAKPPTNADFTRTDAEKSELKNVFREDGNPHESGAFTEALLKEAPETEGGYVKVKKIL